MKPELKRAAELAAEYIETFDTHKITQGPNADALRAKLCKDLTRNGLPPLQVIEELHEDAKDGLLNSAGGRFFRLGNRRQHPGLDRRRLADIGLGPMRCHIRLFAGGRHH